jgi:Xaa-Pro aminopeptidase
MQGFEPPFWTSDEISEHNGFPRYPNSEMTRRHSWLDSLIADGAPILFVRLWNHLPDAQQISTIEDIRYGGDTPGAQAEAVARLLSGHRAARIGLIGSIPHSDLEVMRRQLGEVSLIDLHDHYQRFRLVKTEAEMVFTRVASRMNDATIAALADQLRPGMYEYEAARVIEGSPTDPIEGTRPD